MKNIQHTCMDDLNHYFRCSLGKTQFSQYVSGKSGKGRSLAAGCRDIYWSFGGNVHHNREQWIIWIQAESWMRYDVIAQTVKSTCMESYYGNNSWWLFLLAEAFRQPITDSFYIMLAGAVQCGYMKELHIIGCPTERENQASTSKCEK